MTTCSTGYTPSTDSCTRNGTTYYKECIENTCEYAIAHVCQKADCSPHGNDVWFWLDDTLANTMNSSSADMTIIDFADNIAQPSMWWKYTELSDNVRVAIRLQPKDGGCACPTSTVDISYNGNNFALTFKDAEANYTDADIAILNTSSGSTNVSTTKACYVKGIARLGGS